MPLVKSPSKNALAANIRTEIKQGGKKPAQAAAIGYAVKRAAEGKKK